MFSIAVQPLSKTNNSNQYCHWGDGFVVAAGNVFRPRHQAVFSSPCGTTHLQTRSGYQGGPNSSAQRHREGRPAVPLHLSIYANDSHHTDWKKSIVGLLEDE
jgi:hypothetical protein